MTAFYYSCQSSSLAGPVGFFGYSKIHNLLVKSLCGSDEGALMGINSGAGLPKVHKEIPAIGISTCLKEGFIK